MTPEEMNTLLDVKFAQSQKDLADAQKNNASKTDLEELIASVKTQGEALDDFIEAQKTKVIKNILGQFGDFIVSNKDAFEEMEKTKKGEVKFTPKVVGDITTGSGADIDTVPLDVSTQLGSFGYRNDNNLLSLTTQSSTNKPSYPYTEMIPKDGSYAFVAEGEVKPQIDFSWENRYATPKKAAAYEILTEESITDYPRLMSVAREYLTKNHDLFKVDGVYFGDGIGDNPTGATVYGRTFVSTGMVDVFELGESNFMDVVNAIITDVYRTAAYENQAPFQPNIVLINPIDFFVQLVGAKDGNGLPLFPQAGLFNVVRIGGVTIKPWIKIPLGDIFVADMKKYNVINYVPFSIRVGFINDQFITNKFTMLGESRYYQFVKNVDQAAFVYDTISAVKLAITKAT